MDQPKPILSPTALQALPLGAVRPVGWLRNQFRIQASGLSGHLNEFWPDIRDSASGVPAGISIEQAVDRFTAALNPLLQRQEVILRKIWTQISPNDDALPKYLATDKEAEPPSRQLPAVQAT